MTTTPFEDEQVIHSDATKEKLAAAVSEEFQNFLADIESLIKAVTSLTGKELEDAKAQVSERIVIAKIKLEQLRLTLAQQASNTIAITDNYVHEQPWKAVGIGTAIGFLVGLLAARRN